MKPSCLPQDTESYVEFFRMRRLTHHQQTGYIMEATLKFLSFLRVPGSRTRREDLRMVHA